MDNSLSLPHQQNFIGYIVAEYQSKKKPTKKLLTNGIYVKEVVMRNLLFNAYNKSPDFIADQILHLEGLPAYPGEEHVKQDTLRDLKTLLTCALIGDAHKWRMENENT